MKQKDDNKRSKDRIPLSEKVEINCENMNKFITEYADNISLGGMFIKMDRPFPTGTRFNLELTIKDTGRKISGVGEVVWTKESASSRGSRPSGMGIRFVELFGDSRSVIADLIASSSEI